MKNSLGLWLKKINDNTNFRKNVSKFVLYNS